MLFTIAEKQTTVGNSQWEGISKSKPEDLPVHFLSSMLSGEKQLVFGFL